MDVFRRRSEMCDAGEFEEGSEGYRCQAGNQGHQQGSGVMRIPGLRCRWQGGTATEKPL